ncbi:hypothetical protein GCM10009552_22560 [Rothia nasimurium]|uniref:YfhO family protein n=1 Tax=Luteibacter anthropi TaxID=564369 RepID=A0A7X5UAR6_9GAMM|nr:hypothetical protein [Luteibacter anthropi]NII07033.1 hypothetical protein [Luteibacter anthropi]
MSRFSLSRGLAVLVLLWAALHLPLLLGFRVLPGDAMSEFYPVAYFNAHSLREGLAPWWNPFIFSGYPQIADPQGMLFSPLLTGWMLLRKVPGPTWFIWGALLHLLLGAVSMFALLRRLRSAWLGALVGATVFMAGGVAASRIQYTPILIVYCLLPLVLLALLRLFEQPGVLRAGMLGLVIGWILVQPVQLTYFVGLLLCGFTAVSLVRRWRRQPGEPHWKLIALLVFAGFLGVVLALPQLLFSYAFVQVSNRPALPLADALERALDWRSLLTLVDPNALHSLRGHYDGPADPIETFFYVGALPLLCIGFGARRMWAEPSWRRYLVFFGVAALLAVIYMVGDHTPVYALLYEWFPGVKQFRRPSDSAYLINLLLAFASAFAISRMDLGCRRQLSWLFGLSFAWLLLASIHMRGNGASWQAPSIMAAVVAAMAWGHVRYNQRIGVVAFWMLALIVVDYRCFNLNGAFNQRGDPVKRFQREGATHFLAARSRAEGHNGFGPRTETQELGAGWRNNFILDDIPATHGYGPLRWSVYDRWYGASVYTIGDGPRPLTDYNPDPGGALNRLLGVRYVVQRAGMGSTDWQSPLPDDARVYADAKVEVLENPAAYPRVMTPVHVRTLAPGQAPAPEAFAATDFATTLWLTPRDAADASGIPSHCNGLRQLDGTDATHIQTTVRSSGEEAGWILVTDQDFPGWVARVDGVEVPSHRADGLLRAVCVRAGPHTLTFTFQPWRMVAEAFRRPDSWR